MGLQSTPDSPCIFTGTLFPDSKPLYLGLYVDDFIYFSEDPAVERAFESQLQQQISVEFLGVSHHFLGIRLHWTETTDTLSVHLSQPAFIDDLLQRHGLSDSNPVDTPYKSGVHVDTITGELLQDPTIYQSLVGSLNLLVSISRPDISTITGLLAQYNQHPTTGHLEAAKHVLRYVVGTRHLGISFHSFHTLTNGAYNLFPLAHADANWGPQDASYSPTDPTMELAPHVSRSISGHIAFLAGGPVKWASTRQPRTALSSTSAEIWATSEATSTVMDVIHLLRRLDLYDLFFPASAPVVIYNDNKGCVDWSKGTATKSHRHIHMRENNIHEHIADGHITVSRIPGHDNLADILTKEMKDSPHFIVLRDSFMTSCPIT